MNTRPQAWLDQAQNDLALARLAHDQGFHAQACFFASQAAEKTLKGAILELGAEPPRTHQLSELVECLGQLGAPTATLEELRLNALSRMATSSRYPDDDIPPLRRFDSRDSDEAIRCAAAVLKQILHLDQA